MGLWKTFLCYWTFFLCSSFSLFKYIFLKIDVLLILTVEVNVNFKNGSQVLNSPSGTDGDKWELTGLLILLIVQLQDTTLFVEEPEVLIVLPANVVNHISFNGNEMLFQLNLFNGSSHVFLCPARDCDLSEVRVGRTVGLFNEDANVELFWDLLYFWTSTANDKTDKGGINLDLSNDSVTWGELVSLLSLLLSVRYWEMMACTTPMSDAHIHNLFLRVQEYVSLYTGTLQLVLCPKDHEFIIVMIGLWFDWGNWIDLGLTRN